MGRCKKLCCSRNGRKVCAGNMNNLRSFLHLQPPVILYQNIFEQSNPILPVVCILSPGADPLADITKLAEKLGFAGNRLKVGYFHILKLKFYSPLHLVKTKATPLVNLLKMVCQEVNGLYYKTVTFFLLGCLRWKKYSKKLRDLIQISGCG